MPGFLRVFADAALTVGPGLMPRGARIVAPTTAYGITKADTVTLPWYFLNESVDIVIPAGSNVSCEGAGNAVLPGVPAGFFSARLATFTAPGVYNYHDTRTGAAGRIVVTTGLN